MVKVVKQIICKADQTREDAHLAMLAYWITPRRPGELSPDEAMTQHKFKALLMGKQCLSAWLDENRKTLIQQKWGQAEYYDHMAGQLQQNQSSEVQ